MSTDFEKSYSEAERRPSDSAQGIVCIIGTELTRGIIQDSHTKLITASLDALGISVRRVVIIPDDGRITEVLQDAVRDADVLICTGGLGPTSDDITRDSIAAIAGVPLKADEQALKELRERIRRPVGENDANYRQVMIPEGFTVLPNPLGTAPGFCGKAEDATVYCMPGPPREMERMLNTEVLPLLKQRLLGSDRSEGECEERFETLEAVTFMIPESKLEELCRSCRTAGVEWGTRIQEFSISLYLRGGSRADRREMLQRLQMKAGAELVREGPQGLPERVVRLCAESANPRTLVFAESCTGGYIGKLITDVPGSSRMFWGSFVTYADAAKMSMLGVSQETLRKHGAVSSQTAEEMAVKALKHSDADFSCGVTGIAGPGGGSKEKPAGTVWIAAAGKDRTPVSVLWNFSYPKRDLIRRRASIAALLMCEAFINGQEVLDRVKKWQYI